MKTIRTTAYALALAVLLPMGAAAQQSHSGAADTQRAAKLPGSISVEKRLDQLNKQLHQELQLRIESKEQPQSRRSEAKRLA